jgi:hypothetical protein
VRDSEPYLAPSPPLLYIATGLALTVAGVAVHRAGFPIGGIMWALIGCYRLWYPRRRPQ